VEEGDQCDAEKQIKLHIDVDIEEANGRVWRFTGVYGESQGDKKFRTWEMLKRLSTPSDGPWMCAGDFNEILYNHEKEGGRSCPQSYMDQFREALEACELQDLGFFEMFSLGETIITGCRATSENVWTGLLQTLNGVVYFQQQGCSMVIQGTLITDQSLQPWRNEMAHHAGGMGGFNFEACWLEEEDFWKVVEEAWEQSTAIQDSKVMGALKGVATGLKHWSPNVLGDLERRVKKVKVELERCRAGGLIQEAVTREEILRFKLDRLEEQVDIYWRQRAHVKWLEKGDRNIGFFHATCSERKRRNRVGRLRNGAGLWEESEEGKKAVVSNYFKNLFRSSGLAGRTQHLLDVVEPLVTGEMNEQLCKPFSVDEVEKALNSIGDLKAPGPDGLPAIFYKKCWDLVGNKVTDEVLVVLAGGDFPDGWIDTTIALIPKVSNPEEVKDLRPISLCNVLYKMVSKVLANRLKVILPEIISPAQSAFVLGRLISDNTLVAYEILHYMRNKRRGEADYATIKLDMSKAYDMVEWNFLKDMMTRMGFSHVWTDLIMKCVSSVKYKVKINGSLTEEIVPERGLRQDDPLSPYLFLLCAEGFSALLRKAETIGEIGGVKICQGAPSISHPLFADDSLILVRANGEDATKLQSILDLYAECLGQVINKEKSAIMFSKNTRASCKVAVMQKLGIARESLNDKYLGLPIVDGGYTIEIHIQNTVNMPRLQGETT